MSNLLKALREDGSINVNKNIARELGVDEAIMLTELVGLFFFYKDRKELNNGYFYSTIENLQYQTCLKRSKQDKALKVLIEKGFISKITKGQPAKRYFKIHEEVIMAYIEELRVKYEAIELARKLEREAKRGNYPQDHSEFVENQQTGLLENNKLDCPKTTRSNTNNNTYKNKRMNECMGDSDESVLTPSEKENTKTPKSNLYNFARKQEVSDELSRAVKDVLRERASLLCFVKDGETMSAGDIDETHNMLLNQYPNMLDPEIVYLACEIFSNDANDIMGNVTLPEGKVLNPPGYFGRCYKKAITKYKADRYADRYTGQRA